MKQMTNGRQLLADYAENGSETAFRELVSNYVDLVYSAAVRLVNNDSHLAEDVTQTVFADLAKMAQKVSRDAMLGGWLHRHTVFVASKIMRGERRRQVRERQAVEMNELEDHSAANLAQVAPILDEAINELGAEDRAAIMLRFFEQQDFRSVGEALGNNEDAARKRVDRALEKLESLLKRRGIALSATALAATLGTSAVSAAPVGLAVSISSAALASAAAGGGTTLTILKIMSMTKMKVAVVGVIVAAGVAIPLAMQHKTNTELRAENETLRQQASKLDELTKENERLARLAASPTVASAAKTTNDPQREVLRLRGEVGKLRQINADTAASKTNGPSMLSAMRDNPDMWKMIRDQQKMGMGMIYGKFSKDAKLPKEQSEKLNDLLADNIMENIDRITEVLQGGKTGADFEAVFAAQDASLLEKAKELLGPDNFSQYEDYTRKIASHLTAEQFKEKLTGDKAAKDVKAKQLYQVMQEESEQALARAGLPPDFQTVPMLNFRNIASETEGEKNLKLLSDIYERVNGRVSSFLSPDETEKLKEFQKLAINNNRMGLVLNRKMMAPGAK